MWQGHLALVLNSIVKGMQMQQMQCFKNLKDLIVGCKRMQMGHLHCLGPVRRVLINSRPGELCRAFRDLLWVAQMSVA